MDHNILPHDHGQESKINNIINSLPDSREFGAASDLFRLISDGTRIKIFWILCHCEECVINLSAIMNMTSPAVSHHLKILKSAGLIISRREGKEVYYKAGDSAPAQALHIMIENLLSIACPD